MGLEGKGYFIWQIRACDGGVPSAIAMRAKRAGLTHVLIKIADGSNWAYNLDPQTKADLIPPVVTALKAAGVRTWGWHYVRGDAPLGEARLGGQRARDLGLDGYVIDAEKEYKGAVKRVAAQRYMTELRRILPDMPIALSSYRYPLLHRELPFDVFLEQCDYAMPQVYFEQSHDPEVQLERSLAQYQSLHPARPVIPTAPTYATGGWRPTAQEITRFISRAKSLGLKGVNAWSWDFAARTPYIDLWNAVADFEWDPKPAEPPPMTIAETLVARWNTHKPKKVVELYTSKAAHVTGARTVVGSSAILEWYRALQREVLPDAKYTLTGVAGGENSWNFTWTARSDRARVTDGCDTLGLRDGKIQYHYTYFTLSPL
jgi:hypothetical protein